VFNPLFLFYIKYLLFKIVSPDVRSECCRFTPTVLCLSIQVSQVVLRANVRQASHLQTCTHFRYQSRGIARESKFLAPNEPDLCDREGPLAREPCPLTEMAHLQENLLLGDPQFAFLTLVLLLELEIKHNIRELTRPG
jgi:hypothetical protein